MRPDQALDRALAVAKALHPSSRNVGQGGEERHLSLVKPTPPPATPEAWSAGLWGSFA